jgi:citrate lyase subunit beta/citryl-CoA lyase
VTAPPAGLLASARTFLFVPGDRPDRFAKATDSGADVVVVDLEDAVAALSKDIARTAAARWLAEGGRACVRVNDVTGDRGRADLAALTGLPGLLGVVVPKAEDPGAAEHVAAVSGVPVVPLVESAAGMVAVHGLAAAAGVVRLAFGHLDYAVDLGAQPSRDAMLSARSALVLASRAAGLPAPVDGVTTDVHAEATLVEDLLHSTSLGMTGKLLVHPAQVAAAHRTLRPDGDQVRWARRVLAAVGSGEGVVVLDGEMVDAPVVARARAVLAAG